MSNKLAISRIIFNVVEKVSVYCNKQDTSARFQWLFNEKWSISCFFIKLIYICRPT